MRSRKNMTKQELEKVRAYYRTYNRQRYRERKQSDKTFRPKLNAQQRRYYRKNKEKIREYNRNYQQEYRRKHRDRLAIKLKEYRKKHPDLTKNERVKKCIAWQKEALTDSYIRRVARKKNMTLNEIQERRLRILAFRKSRLNFKK